jgi:hypothetical protein
MEFDNDYRRRYEMMVENEMRILRERREKAAVTADEMKRQKVEKEAQTRDRKAQDRSDGILVAKHMEWEAECEQQRNAAKRRRAREDNEANKRYNDELRRNRDRMQEMEGEEERRVFEMRGRMLDEEDARKAAEIKRRDDRLQAQQHLIDAEANRQIATRKVQEDFLDKQVQEQFVKDQQKVEQIVSRKKQFEEARRKEYGEVVAMKDEEKKRKFKAAKRKRPFVGDGHDPELEAAERRERERRARTKEIELYQRRQIHEKKEREAAEKERERLEVQHGFDDHHAFLQRAQQYAAEMLRKAQEREDENDRAVLSLM